MKMIDVLNMVAEGKIKQGTKLEIGNKIYTYTEEIARRECYFIDIEDDEIELLEDAEIITEKFLNFDVKLIEPKENKYLVKLTIKGIADTYLNRSRETSILFLSDSFEGQYSQTKFTKQEMQDIQLVREFLKDMEGKYELIEVEECD